MLVDKYRLYNWQCFIYPELDFEKFIKYEVLYYLLEYKIETLKIA